MKAPSPPTSLLQWTDDCNNKKDGSWTSSRGRGSFKPVSVCVCVYVSWCLCSAYLTAVGLALINELNNHSQAGYAWHKYDSTQGWKTLGKVYPAIHHRAVMSRLRDQWFSKHHLESNTIFTAFIIDQSFGSDRIGKWGIYLFKLKLYDHIHEWTCLTFSPLALYVFLNWC